MTIETNNVVELIEATRRAAAIGLSSSNKTARKLGDHLNSLADAAQSLSDRIDVQRRALLEASLALETLARRVFNDNGDHTIDMSPLDPDVFSACYYAAQTVSASLTQGGKNVR